MSRFTAIAASATVFGLLLGCAAGPGHGPTPPAGLTWGGYLYGEDLRRTCDESGPDRYRFVVNAALPGQPVRIFEAEGTSDGGGFIEVRDFAIGRVADIGPGEPYRMPGDGDRGDRRLSLSPAQFSALGERLVAGGTLIPPSLAPDVTRGLNRWFATGCRGGAYFVSAVSQAPAQEVRWTSPLSPRRR